jgi:tRNA modification GTPase
MARLMDPGDGRPIDQALVLRFPAPASFTGEDLVEIQHHGGLAVRRMLSGSLARLPGLRPAQPGEFTRRSFLNGKLDLAEVVGLGDLIDATTARAARGALLRLEGGLSQRVKAWSDRLLELRASIEAEIDFAADQSDVAADAVERSLGPLRAMSSELADVLRQAPAAVRMREGFVVAVVGPPNVGKSSLVNLLAGREVAIVTAHPGTTRDPIEVELDLHGLPVTLVDTAGLRETDDAIEREGIRRAREKAEAADLVLELVDARDAQVAPSSDRRRLVVANKSDLSPSGSAYLAISCQEGTGISELLDEILLRLSAGLPEELGALPPDAHAVAAVVEARAAVDQALDAAEMREPALVAEELHHAAQAFARITGTGVDPEEVLEAIFARFCIGK